MTESERLRKNDTHRVTTPAKCDNSWLAQEKDDGFTSSNMRICDPLVAAMQPIRLRQAISAQAPLGQATLVQQSILGLQRTHGNRYVQRMLGLARRAEGEGEVTPEVEGAIESARGGGQSLDTSVRRKMETAFGANFAGVRIHTDSTADELNHAVNALAFTTGSDIFFRSGMYEPSSSSGQELLAHELTHVVQQGESVVVSRMSKGLVQRMCSTCEEERDKRVQRKLVVGEPDDQYEQEAEQVSKTIVSKLNADTPSADNPASSHPDTLRRNAALQRQEGDGGIGGEVSPMTQDNMAVVANQPADFKSATMRCINDNLSSAGIAGWAFAVIAAGCGLLAAIVAILAAGVTAPAAGAGGPPAGLLAALACAALTLGMGLSFLAQLVMPCIWPTLNPDDIPALLPNEVQQGE